ncbi:MAG: hypothetical protein LUG18_07910 [Candidatus Azobacteroides sp.]|nr:hypothetical protein [Candidatus Azobacteroides sp.]
MKTNEIIKGQFYSFKIRGRKEKEKGILIEEGKEWILIKSLFTDYVIDGFKIINKKYV